MKRTIPTIQLCLALCLALHAQTTVEFTVSDLPENTTKQVGIRGDQPPLSWYKSIAMEKAGTNYQVTLEFPEETAAIEFKFVLFDSDEQPVWESNENRSLNLGEKKEITSPHQWDVEQLVDIKALPKLQPEQLMEDFKLIETMVLDVHPGTYRYNDQASIQKVLAELKSRFQQPLTHGEAYLAMSRVTAQIKCDHTKVGFNNQKKTINSVIHRQRDKLPFTFKWIEGKMIVVYNASQAKALKRGTEILSINGVAVSDIQTAMLPYIAADGATDKNRFVKMEVEGFNFRYNAFDVFYPLLFPLTSEKLSLEVKNPGSLASSKITVKTLTRTDRYQILTARYPDFPKTRNEMWDFQITDKNVGILTLNSFGLMGWKRMTLDYKQFLADAFAKLKEKEVEHLIIDIRKNNGGNDEIKHELFTYFDIDRKLAGIPDREGRSRYRTFPEGLKSYIQTWGDNPWYFNLEPDREDKTAGYYIFEEQIDKSNWPKEKKNAFSGKIYLLSSPGNTSLAYYTTRDFKKYKVGTVIGKETGGNLRGINGGQILFLRLPNSGIEIDFPVVGGFTFGDQPNQGVLPDVETQTSLQDFLEERDVEMETAMKLIKKD